MYELNDILILKKPHPCGGVKWQVVRLGADVKLRCCTCRKYVNLMRDDLQKRVKNTETEKGERKNGEK
ncbi:MAG: DUF951 domain-containing protein [Clostridia bacterium]|nr:DUF951 domain-containing protein [Clostridia bacterium]